MGGGEFRELVDDLMAQTPPTPEHFDYAMIWKKRLEEEEGARLRSQG
jgi:hypothetical protein